MSDQQQLINYLNSMVVWINKIFGSSFVPVGMVLDMFTIYTFSRATLRNNSTLSLFYMALGVYDIFALINYTLFYTLPAYGIKPINASDSACKILSVLKRTLGVCSSWTETLITFDRFRSVVYPHKFKFITNRRTLKIILGKNLSICLLVK